MNKLLKWQCILDIVVNNQKNQQWSIAVDYIHWYTQTHITHKIYKNIYNQTTASKFTISLIFRQKTSKISKKLNRFLVLNLCYCSAEKSDWAILKIFYFFSTAKIMISFAFTGKYRRFFCYQLW